MKGRLTLALLAGLLMSSVAMIAPPQALADHGWHHGGWHGGWHDNGRHLGWYKHNWDRGWDRDWDRSDFYRYGPRNFNGAWFNRGYYGNYPTYSRYRF